MINTLLNEFWAWINLTPQEYACGSSDNSIEEYMFPHWEELLNSAYQCIDQSDVAAITNVLTAMAIDNEEESILDYLTEKANDEYINSMICHLVTHEQPHARWQGAELIARRNPRGGIYILNQLLHDKNSYVKKRASNAYCQFRINDI